jgi:hypothetical protein
MVNDGNWPGFPHVPAVQLLAEHTNPETLRIRLAVSAEQTNPKPKKFGVQPFSFWRNTQTPKP